MYMKRGGGGNENTPSQGPSMELLYEMVPVKDDSLKHLTHKNGFLARAEQQPKVINSFEMLRKMERKRCEEGRRVTRRAIERDKDVKREEDERGKEKNNTTGGQKREIL